MRRETIFELESLYRSTYSIEAFTFGEGSKEEHPELSIAVMGSLRGDEVQQLYIASQLVEHLRRLEERGLVNPDAEIRVIPCGNPFSLNTATRFWAPDNTDVNRMFPGYGEGETTQRIAAGIFEALKGYGYGVQLTSFYLPGSFVPHVRMMNVSEDSDLSIVHGFGMPYAVIRTPEPVDSGTLNYNWQVFDTQAVSLYSERRGRLDERAAEQALFALLRFMTTLGIITYDLHAGYITTIVKEEHLVSVRAGRGGLVTGQLPVGRHVFEGAEIATVTDPISGRVLDRIKSPVSGMLFFSGDSPLVGEDSILYKIIDDRVIAD